MKIRTLLIALLFWLPAAAQPPARTGEPPGFLFFEGVPFPGPDSTHSRVDIHYRIDRSFFVAVRNDEPDFPSPFRRRGEIVAELIGEDGVSRAREIERIDLGDMEAERALENREWIAGLFSFTVSPGTYTILLQFDDLESKRSLIERNRKIAVPAFGGSVLDIAGPLFVRPTRSDTGGVKLEPMNFGGDLEFGSPARFYCEGVSPAPGGTPLSIHYEFFVVEGSKQEVLVLQDSVLALPVDTTHILVPTHGFGDAAYLLQEGRRRGFSVSVPFAAERLPLRPLKMKFVLRQGSLVREIIRPLRTVWPEMPFSLRDVDYALSLLKYLTTEAQLDSLQSGGYEQRRAHLENFWKERDQTPETPMNEVMAEFYHRVDHSMREFATMRQADGAKTDRGRVYILVGPPSRIERSLDPAHGYREIWIYEHIHKKFTFADADRNGTYVLVGSQNL